MDWKSLKNKALEASAKALSASAKALEQGKDYIEKAKDAKEEVSEKIETVKEKAQDIKEAVTEKSQDIKEKTEEKVAEGKSFAEKLKDMGSKAMESTTGALGKTAPTLKIMADYEAIKDDKIVALLFLQKDDDESRKFQLSMPMIMSNVWINGSTFRVVDIDDSPDVAANFDIIKVPFLVAFEKGEEKKRTDDTIEIKRYLKEYIV